MELKTADATLRLPFCVCRLCDCAAGLKKCLRLSCSLHVSALNLLSRGHGLGRWTQPLNERLWPTEEKHGTTLFKMVFYLLG